MVKLVLGEVESRDRLGMEPRGVTRRADDVGGVDLGLGGGNRLACAIVGRARQVDAANASASRCLAVMMFSDVINARSTSEP
jgi:hypothetical protein